MSKLIISFTPNSIVCEETRRVLASIVRPLVLDLHDVVRFVVYDDELIVKTRTDCYTFSKHPQSDRFVITHSPAYACTEIDQKINTAIKRMQQMFDTTL